MTIQRSVQIQFLLPESFEDPFSRYALAPSALLFCLAPLCEIASAVRNQCSLSWIFQPEYLWCSIIIAWEPLKCQSIWSREREIGNSGTGEVKSLCEIVKVGRNGQRLFRFILALVLVQRTGEGMVRNSVEQLGQNRRNLANNCEQLEWKRWNLEATVGRLGWNYWEKKIYLFLVFRKNLGKIEKI